MISFKYKRRYAVILSVILIVFSVLTSCTSGYAGSPDSSGTQNNPERDLMKNIIPGPIPEKLPDEDFYTMVNDFASRLFIELYSEGENIAVSPVSVLQSLLLAANGASGKSRDEIINAVNRSMELEDLNSYIATYANNLRTEHGSEMNVSVWAYRASENITPVKSFLQLNVDYYLGKAYLLELSEDYPALVSEWMTDYAGMKNLSGIDINTPGNTKAVNLVGMLTGSFDWENPFENTVTGSFTRGEEKYDVNYLVSYENAYISYNYASGILKGLDNGMSVALLKPEHGFSLETVILHLSAGRLTRIYESAVYSDTVKVSVPEFSFSGTPDIVSALEGCGVKTVFDELNSDIGNMFGGDGKIYLGGISTPVKFDFSAGGVSLDGTKVYSQAGGDNGDNGDNGENGEDGDGNVSGEYTEMIFDTPFMYILFDGEGCPVFMGKVEIPDTVIPDIDNAFTEDEVFDVSDIG